MMRMAVMSATDGGDEELPDDEEDDEGDGGRQVYPAHSRQDLPEGCEDGLGDAHEEGHDGVGGLTDDPGEEAAGEDGKHQDQGKNVEEVGEEVHFCSPRRLDFS